MILILQKAILYTPNHNTGIFKLYIAGIIQFQSPIIILYYYTIAPKHQKYNIIRVHNI